MDSVNIKQQIKDKKAEIIVIKANIKSLKDLLPKRSNSKLEAIADKMSKLRDKKKECSKKCVKCLEEIEIE
jgi:hypothetical protein